MILQQQVLVVWCGVSIVSDLTAANLVVLWHGEDFWCRYSQ